MTTLLEQRYQRWLRLLPGWYRAEREGELLATFMEGQEDTEAAEIGRPRWAEIRGILGLAVRTRLGGAGAPPRSRLWGEGVRLFAVCTALAQAMLAVNRLVGVAVLVRRGPVSPGPVPGVTAPSPAVIVRSMVPVVLPCVWVIIFVAVVLGSWRIARWASIAAVMSAPYSLYSSLQEPGTTSLQWLEAVTETTALGVLPAVTVVIAFHGDAPETHRTWLTALPLGAILLLGEAAFVPLMGTDVASTCSWLFLGAGGGYLLLHKFAPQRCAAGWPLGLALLSGPVVAVRAGVLALQVESYLNMAASGAPPWWMRYLVAVAAVQTVAVTAMGVGFTVAAVRLLRRTRSSPMPGGRPMTT